MVRRPKTFEEVYAEAVARTNEAHAMAAEDIRAQLEQPIQVTGGMEWDDAMVKSGCLTREQVQARRDKGLAALIKLLEQQ